MTNLHPADEMLAEILTNAPHSADRPAAYRALRHVRDNARSADLIQRAGLLLDEMNAADIEGWA